MHSREKLVIKVTIYRDVDRDLYDSVSGVLMRQRSSVIRYWWQRGLQRATALQTSARPAEAQNTSIIGNGEGALPQLAGVNDKRLGAQLDTETLGGLSVFV
ncbi:MAG: hypothetical protein ACYDEV_09305 [Acidiferrobacter sp.]